MQSIIKLIRPHQWIKNGFVLIGVAFSHRWDVLTLTSAALAFLAFCLVASGVYVMNDLLDVEADRKHPTKCKRPIASGAISVTQARLLAAGLALVAVTLAWIGVSPMAAALIAAYWTMNLGYSLHWKHVAILDVFIIAAGFMLRILVGTLGLHLGVSHWLILCGMMVTLFLGFAKRRAELLLIEGDADRTLTRRVLEHYSPALLDQCISVCAGGTIVAYSLYTMSAETIALHHTDKLVYTVPFIVYGIFRYLYLLHGHGRGNDTASDLLQDRHLIATVFAWIGTTLWLIV